MLSDFTHSYEKTNRPPAIVRYAEYGFGPNSSEIGFGPDPSGIGFRLRGLVACAPKSARHRYRPSKTPVTGVKTIQTNDNPKGGTR